MPRFTQDVETLLKRIMFDRLPTCVFTSDDIELVMKDTGVDREAIQHWARQLRWKMSSSMLPGNMSVEEFLKSSPESLSDKVI